MKSRSSFNEVLLNKDKINIKSFLKNTGYYFSTIKVSLDELEDNKVNLTYNISLEKKQKLKKFLSLVRKFLKIKN